MRIRNRTFDRVAGVVAFFNPEKRYGFLRPTEPPLPRQNNIYVGGAVEALFRSSTGGLFVAGARAIVGDVVPGPTSYVATRIIYSSARESILNGEWLHATGKWLHTGMGYGFVILECGAEVFVHKETVRKGMNIQDAMPFGNNPFMVRVAYGSRGLYASEIRKP
jgi:cold shock CspA family protein